MRVVVKLPRQAYAELIAEMERIPQRARAERLRMLATIGLTIVNAGIRPIAQLDQSASMAEQEPERVVSARFQRLRERLRTEMK